MNVCMYVFIYRRKDVSISCSSCWLMGFNLLQKIPNIISNDIGNCDINTRKVEEIATKTEKIALNSMLLPIRYRHQGTKFKCL